MKLFSSNTLFRRQFLMLFSGTILNMIVGLLLSILITRLFGPELYGHYNFLLSVFNFVQVFFMLGIFHSTGRLLSLNFNAERARGYYGGSLLILGVISLLMTVTLMLYARFDFNIGNKGLTTIMYILAPFGWIYLMTSFFEVVFQGDNRIALLTQVRLTPKIVFLILLLTLVYAFGKTGLTYLMLAYSLSFAFVFILILLHIRPHFRFIKKRLGEILSMNKKYGIYLYYSSLLTVSLANFKSLLISYFSTDNVGVGFYALATVICSPLAMIPAVTATILFKDFANQPAIPGKTIFNTTLLTIASLLALQILVQPFISLVYGDKFMPAVAVTRILAVGTLLYGLGDFFNRFISAHGFSKLILRNSFITGSVQLFAGFLLIKFYGAPGAAWTMVISGSVYLFMMIWYYYKITASKIQS